MSKLVCGVGIFEKGKFSSYSNGRQSRIYSLWANMLQRCYSAVYQDKHPTYLGCSVSENFKNFQYFAEWCSNQIGFDSTGWQLDKDIVFKGNKLYSEHTCFFIPRILNLFLNKSNSIRGDCPIGVHFDKSRGKFLAYCHTKSTVMKNLGRYDTKEEAFQAYKTAKESLAKQLAKEYEGLVHPKVIEALNKYVVEITD